VIRAYLLSHEKGDEDVLGVNVQRKIVGRADRCANLAAQADRKVFPAIAGMFEYYVMIFFIHRSVY
jgi:hypothetical protein